MIHAWETVSRLFVRPDVAIFHTFRRPPYGGANQFLLALRGELGRRGLRVAANTITRGTRACLLDSYAFDYRRLRRMAHPGCRMVHRVDGPLGLYRGMDDGTDRRVFAINQETADVTVFQSIYSREGYRALGLTFRAPLVIMNAVDPTIFHPRDRALGSQGRKVRLISTAWSSNPNKGAATYRWLEEHLDWDRFEYTFVGQSPLGFERIRLIPALPSRQVADLLRAHDVYITASLHDPCSNALLEALACGLPAIYANSGGHPEIVGEAGFGFSAKEEIPALLDRLVDEYEARRARIAIPTLATVADQYLSAMGLEC